MNVGNILCNIYFASFLPHMAKSHSNFNLLKYTLYKRGCFLMQSILCDKLLLPSSLCMGQVHLEIRSHKRGLGLKKICVMNMRDLRH